MRASLTSRRIHDVSGKYSQSMYHVGKVKISSSAKRTDIGHISMPLTGESSKSGHQSSRPRDRAACPFETATAPSGPWVSLCPSSVLAERGGQHVAGGRSAT